MCAGRVTARSGQLREEETGGRFAVGENFYQIEVNARCLLFLRSVAKQFFCQSRFVPLPPLPIFFMRFLLYRLASHEGVDQFYAQNFDSSITILITTIIIRARWGGREGASTSVRRDVEKGGRGRLGPLDSDYG